MNKLILMYYQLNWLHLYEPLEIEYIDIDGMAHSYAGSLLELKFHRIMRNDKKDGLYERLQDYEMISVTMSYSGSRHEWTVRALLQEAVK